MIPIETVYPKLVGAAILWFAYPKKSSKKYISEFNRDYDWGILGDYNLELINQVLLIRIGTRCALEK